jgi:hypothetical protein
MSIFLSTAEFQYLLDELDELFPDTYPDYSLSEKEIAFRAGQVDVVRFLKKKLSED